MTDERIKELADKWNLFPTDNAWDEVMGFAYDLLAEKREWVGLTNEEIDDLWKTEYFNIHYELPRAIEAKLKEKNT